MLFHYVMKYKANVRDDDLCFFVIRRNEYIHVRESGRKKLEETIVCVCVCVCSVNYSDDI